MNLYVNNLIIYDGNNVCGISMTDRKFPSFAVAVFEFSIINIGLKCIF